MAPNGCGRQMCSTGMPCCDSSAMSIKSTLGTCSSSGTSGTVSCKPAECGVTVVMRIASLTVNIVRFYTVTCQSIVIALLRKYILQTALALEYARFSRSALPSEKKGGRLHDQQRATVNCWYTSSYCRCE